MDDELVRRIREIAYRAASTASTYRGDLEFDFDDEAARAALAEARRDERLRVLKVVRAIMCSNSAEQPRCSEIFVGPANMCRNCERFTLMLTEATEEPMSAQERT